MTYMDKMAEFGFIPADHDKPNFFPVAMLDGSVTMPDGTVQKIDGWKALTRTDTKQVLHVWRDGYSLLPHELATQAFDAAIAASNLDRTGMHVASDLTHDGRRLFRQYILPAHTVRLRNPDMKGGDDETALRVIGFNSYDGSMAVSWRGGGYRFVCANRSVIGKDIAAVQAKHTAGLDIDALARGMIEACEKYQLETKRWEKWVGIPVLGETATKLFEAIPGANEGMVGALALRWANEREGDTLWAVFNLLTAWATHQKVRAGSNVASVQHERTELVAKLTDSKVWKAVEDGEFTTRKVKGAKLIAAA